MTRQSRLLCLVISAVLFAPPVQLAADELKLENVVVAYSGMPREYAQAIGRVVAVARSAAIEQFGFNMPKTILVDVHVDPSAQVQLFNDGADRIFLTIRSQQDLLKPRSSGVFQIYGLCHEIGHMAMYRLISDHSWLSTEAAEGWAHYLGSRLTDVVYAKEGGDLWSDRYDYREDGMKRLEKQWSSEKPSGIAIGAQAWSQLANIVGDNRIAPIFKAWGEAKLDPANPADEAGKILLAKSSSQTEQWWNDARDAFVIKRAKSNVTAETVDERKLAGEPVELKHDNGKQAAKQSLAGGGHAVRFEAPSDVCYVTEVRVFGGRYGRPNPPREDFHVWICDKDFKAIADNPIAYSKFPYGNPRWVSLKVKPTHVPREFIVCVGFNPTATKGVFVYFDAGAASNSVVGLPGGDAQEFTKGNWMIRAVVQEKKE